MYADTIAAIATPVGEGGIGIIRLSGPRARPIAEALFRPAGRQGLRDRRLSYGHLVGPDGDVLDEVMVAYMAAPRSYTREDVVELSCHGGPLPLQAILEAVLGQGARLAEPGEFTLRAFLNGRLDLAQAEAVIDVIRARTRAGLRLAVGGLAGNLSGRVRGLRARLLEPLAYLTASVDFPADEVGEQDVAPPIAAALADLSQLLATADAGLILRNGVRTAIVGRPNVGKSSLLNRLLRADRAIVTAVPGTTRDTLEETANLGGVPFVLVDTAGIRQADEEVEQIGIERSRQALERADLVLWVVDCSLPLQPQDAAIQNLIGDRPTLVAANKSDRPRVADLSGWPWPTVHLSAATGAGLDDLERALLAAVKTGVAVASDAALVANPRHRDALVRAEGHLRAALAGLASGMAADFLTIDLTAALNALGEITGETVGEDLLDTIFSRFCIGK